MFLEDAQATAPIYLYTLYVTKSMTGMRFGELLGARETDLDLEHGVVMVEQTLKRPGPQAAFGKPNPSLASGRHLTGGGGGRAPATPALEDRTETPIGTQVPGLWVGVLPAIWKAHAPE
jgi:integrase